ncbi:MAG: HD domain-containing protein [Sulfuricurvum sp.]|nr:HD domain-containing protein [Sulfuricurvum sp.]
MTYVNEPFCDISGYTTEELIGKSHSIVRHPDMSSEVFREMWKTILNKLPWTGIVKNRKKDGSPYWVKVTINPILDHNDEIEEFIAIRNDITETILLHEELGKTQQDMIIRIGEVGETRSRETGHHVRRVAEYSRILATRYGLSEEEIRNLTNASPMHDIGKIGIPDSILQKVGPLDDAEWEVMRTHSETGYRFFKDSDSPLLKAAAIITYEHHEKWDGSGYPRGLKGEAIHIFGRITALADVFDALGSDRCYKKAWENERIFELFRQERGKHFDPILVDLFFKHLDEFLAIQSYYTETGNERGPTSADA